MKWISSSLESLRTGIPSLGTIVERLLSELFGCSRNLLYVVGEPELTHIFLSQAYSSGCGSHHFISATQ